MFEHMFPVAAPGGDTVAAPGGYRRSTGGIPSQHRGDTVAAPGKLTGKKRRKPLLTLVFFRMTLACPNRYLIFI
jgi:hypothetical protein